MKIPRKADIQLSLKNKGISGEGQLYMCGDAFTYRYIMYVSVFFFQQSETVYGNAEGAQWFTRSHD